MAFFEDLGKKLTSAGQAVAQKTKEVAEIAKLNLAIADNEKQINKTYQEIGKLYVEKYADNVGEDFAELVSTIKQAEEEIASLEKQINELKGVCKCEQCGAELNEEVSFCSECGAQIVKEEPAEATEENEETAE